MNLFKRIMCGYLLIFLLFKLFFTISKGPGLLDRPKDKAHRWIHWFPPKHYIRLPLTKPDQTLTPFLVPLAENSATNREQGSTLYIYIYIYIYCLFFFFCVEFVFCFSFFASMWCSEQAAFSSRYLAYVRRIFVLFNFNGVDLISERNFTL